MLADYTPCGGPRGELIFFPFLASASHLCSLVFALFLCLHKFITPTSNFHITLFSPSSTPSPPLYKDPCDHVGLTQIIQDTLPISRSLITSEKCLVLYIRQHIHKFHRLECGHFWRVYNNANTSHQIHHWEGVKKKAEGKNCYPNVAVFKWYHNVRGKRFPPKWAFCRQLSLSVA